MLRCPGPAGPSPLPPARRPRCPSSPWPRRPRGGSRQGAALRSSHGRRWPGGAPPPMHRRAPAGRAATGTGELPAPSPRASPSGGTGSPGAPGRAAGARAGGSGGRAVRGRCRCRGYARRIPGPPRPPTGSAHRRQQPIRVEQRYCACAVQRGVLSAAILEKGAVLYGALREGHARSCAWPRPRSTAHAPSALSRAAGNGR